MPIRLLTILSFTCASLLGSNAYAEKTTQVFKSGASQVELIELYSSEGCSSCPPADFWLGSLKQQPGLWQDFVPVAFHVDYWDDLGWPDRFAKAEYSERQRNYRGKGLSNSVYTPGFFVAGYEWPQWFRGPRAIPDSTLIVGELIAQTSGKNITVSFSPESKTTKNYIANVVLLADHIKNPIARGENHGRLLEHHFLVLDLQQSRNSKNNNSSYQWQFQLPSTKEKPDRFAIAVWISTTDNPQAIQATGGWLSSLK